MSKFEPIKQVSYDPIQKNPELCNLLTSRSIQPPKFTQLAPHGLCFHYPVNFLTSRVGGRPFPVSEIRHFPVLSQSFPTVFWS